MTNKEAIQRNKQDLNKCRSNMSEKAIKQAEQFIKLLEEREKNAK